MPSPTRIVVIGGGIVGLAVAERITAVRPEAQVTVLEKEADWARHQTGRNSGVVHSGLYYKPGSFKAQMCRRGAESMAKFAADEGVAFEQCGKLVVATSADQLDQLRVLADRGRQNGLAVRELTAEQARDIEPHVACVAALYVPETGIIDYRGVCDALVRRLRNRGADLRLNARVVGLHTYQLATVVETADEEFEADAVVNCAGLYSDRVAKLGGRAPERASFPSAASTTNCDPRSTTW